MPDSLEETAPSLDGKSKLEGLYSMCDEECVIKLCPQDFDRKKNHVLQLYKGALCLFGEEIPTQNLNSHNINAKFRNIGA